jgi:hypothetical protein
MILRRKKIGQRLPNDKAQGLKPRKSPVEHALFLSPAPASARRMPAKQLCNLAIKVYHFWRDINARA